MGVKIVDLGLAKRQLVRKSIRGSMRAKVLLQSARNFFISNDATSNIGTFAYMAPEQRKSVYNNKVDIYALGMLLWELNEMERDRDERHFTLLRLRKTGLCDLCNLKTPQAAKLIEWMMSHNPDSRPTAEQVLNRV